VGVAVDACLRLKALSLDPARRLDPGADRSAFLPNSSAARQVAEEAPDRWGSGS